MTRKHFIGAALAAAMTLPAAAQEAKIGLLFGISGGISAMAPTMVEAAQLAVEQVNAQGGIGDGGKLVAALGDSGCNPQAATDAATKAVNIDRVLAIVGPSCSGSVLAAANSVTVPAGVPLVSPSSTSPQVTRLADKDLVFRTVPSDAYQGAALARTLIARGTRSVAVTYLANDYGTGLAESFRAEYEAQGGTITGFQQHDGSKASYRSELSRLARGGADTLVIFDYGDGSGLTILRQSLENGFFRQFVGGDGMKSEAMIRAIGAANLDTLLVSSPVGSGSESLAIFQRDFRAKGGNPDGIFATTSYDAAFLLALAIEHAGGERAKLAASLRAVAGAPGDPVRPGEWARAKKLIAEGRDIDYRGAAGDHEFDEAGDVPGAYALFRVAGEDFEAVAQMH
ncbi:ABC transporter substrate-binding protein [Pseudazoarcus pumilus]|uniref:Amino acid ABC transporter substrate-binding protein n=1 Tax=Pseudazoarcus pumilus TaxID=2067960 RepID=A0A2I6S9M0_9RHOO|nr:ABC transporter substrate-binding protein [Pseudazoarcus pumilus]AUN95952.1 amino acid ABC transporter substrate-binding protein [Pseudazoarcus pumilus]